MDKFQIAQEIGIAATLTSEIDTVKAKGQELCSYLQGHTDEIKHNARHSFHIGSAMYYYRTTFREGEKDSTNYKFTLLAAYVNLFESLSYQDMQSVIGAYRLHILMATETTNYFKPHLMKLLGMSLNDLFESAPDVITKKLNRLFYAAQYSLFYYCQESHSPIAWNALTNKEKKCFEQLYSNFQNLHKISNFKDDKHCEIGIKVLNALYNILCDQVQVYESLGVL